MTDTVGAEGAHTFGWNSQPPTVDNYKPADSNIVQNLNVTKVGRDSGGVPSVADAYTDPTGYTLLPK